MIRGFARRPSVDPGGELELRVSTDARAFRVDVVRWGARVERVARFGPFPGGFAPDHLPHHDWGTDNAGVDGAPLPAWPEVRLPVAADWPSGVYVAVLSPADASGDGRTDPSALDAREGRALFVVRSARPGATASVLYKLPLFTYHAYNQVSAHHWDAAHPDGGWCLYSDFHPRPVPGPPAVSVRRPGGGTGGHTFDTFNPDPHAPTPRQTHVHWDHPTLAWLERAGVSVDVCTDLDLHGPGGDALLAPYRLLLSAGHDEYWSAASRDRTEAFVRDGGNAAFLGGNTCWWRIEFADDHAFRRSGHWHEAGRPENAMTGVSFRNGGERPLTADGPAVGFRVQHADHWVFAGTGLRDGDVFGDGPAEHLVGYECDGAVFDRAREPATPTGADGTPADFTILGIGDVGASGWGEGNRAATLGVHAPGGTVFTAATTDWPRLLAAGHPVVERITRNVVERLS